MGHLQPASSLSPGRQLPNAYQPFDWIFSNRFILIICSHQQQSFAEISVGDRERPEAEVRRYQAIGCLLLITAQILEGESFSSCDKARSIRSFLDGRGAEQDQYQQHDGHPEENVRNHRECEQHAKESDSSDARKHDAFGRRGPMTGIPALVASVIACSST